MNELEIVTVWLITKRLARKKAKRLWIHPINNLRARTGSFHILFEELLKDPSKFFNYFRMSCALFEELLTKVQGTIMKQDTVMRDSITPRERLAITLRYLASGCSMTDVHYSYRVGISTVSTIIKEVCQAIWNDLKNECMVQPNKDRWLEISEGFVRNSNFPNCIGAVDGKHVRVIKPRSSGSLYYNYKHYFSVQLLAICDANYCFTYVDIGDYGKNNDASIYNNSVFHKKLLARTLDVPEPTYLPRRSDSIIPFVLVGDEAFGLSTTMMRPYGGRNLPQEKRVFNYRLSRARRFIECSFGILTNKWRIFHKAFNVDVPLAIDIIKACVILHNFVRVRDGYLHEDSLSYTGLMNNDDNGSSTYSGRAPTALRDYFTNYFVTEGDLPWQYSKL